MRVVSEVKLPNVNKILKDRGLEERGRVQKYIDKTVLDYNREYLPFDSGTLADSGDISSDIGSGELIYNTPYAHYHYKGEVMEDPETGSTWARKGVQKVYRVPTQKMVYRGGGKRGSKWADRMKIDRMDEIVKGAQAIVDGGNKNG